MSECPARVSRFPLLRRSTITLQYIQLILALLLALVFIFVMILPFVADTWVETRRIAELLSQLPPEIDVEAMVVRSLAAAQAKKLKASNEPTSSE